MHSRRDFLQKLTGSAIDFSFLHHHLLAGEGPIDTRPYDGPMLRVAIMGLGSYGTRVAEAMQTCKKARLVGVISGTPAKIKTWQGKYNIPERNVIIMRTSIRSGTTRTSMWYMSLRQMPYTMTMLSALQKPGNMLSVKNRCPSMPNSDRKWWMPVNRQKSNCW